MRTPTHIVNRLDRRRIYEVIPVSGQPPSHIAHLRELLEEAYSFPPHRIPDNVVTMNSVVRIQDPETGEVTSGRLSYPYDARHVRGAVSILEPLGSALLARRVGDVVHWVAPGGLQSGIINCLEYQPEREGHFDR